ncbi:hypothetical protein [Salinimicrobium sp. GXAS 041]|uniref:hypothetical protein n=1 Tax=Salinimicrobium sp. GXAS 041 TaxID=3400806 RepID=UPI003C77778B
MKILFLNSSVPNYLIDGLLHGLRSVPEIEVVDVPRMNFMYRDATGEDLQKTGSRGNTLYKMLPEDDNIRGKRTYWLSDIEKYDYILFTDIFEQCDLFHYIYKSLGPAKRSGLCIIDGYDSASMFPYFHNSFNLKVRPWSYFYNFRKVHFFKREHASTAELYGITKSKFPVLNRIASKILKIPVKHYGISMSIPEEHLEYIPFSQKDQEFVNYNIDKDLNELFKNLDVAEVGKWKPRYEKQEDYFDDIRRSRFGITTKREGWDCLRHYEYAAKGAILCFKELDQKNPLCAPYGLDQSNCIPYQNKEDLLKSISSLNLSQLKEIQGNQYKWIQKYTTRNVALRFLDRLESVNQSTFLEHIEAVV